MEHERASNLSSAAAQYTEQGTRLRQELNTIDSLSLLRLSQIHTELQSLHDMLSQADIAGLYTDTVLESQLTRQRSLLMTYQTQITELSLTINQLRIQRDMVAGACPA